MRIILLFMWTLVSCTSKDKANQDNVTQESSIMINVVDSSEAFSDSIVVVSIPNIGILRWNNITSKIEKDDLYRDLLSHFEDNKLLLAEGINDVSPTQAIACGRKGKLLVGDLVFLLIMDITNMPNPIHSQLDVYEMGCPYPVGYFEVITKDRLGISARVKAFLQE